MAVSRSKRKTISSNLTVPKEGQEIIRHHCRRCMSEKSANKFLSATDHMLDKSGYMSICIDCINSLFEAIYSTELSLDKTILRLCRLLNVKYMQKAVETTQTHLNTAEANGRIINGVFGIYRSKLDKLHDGKLGESVSQDLTFVEPFVTNASEIQLGDGSKDISYFQKIWGERLAPEEYDFLEEEYLRWVGPMGNVSHPQEILIRELCHKQNQIRKARKEDVKNVDSLVEGFQKILKQSGLEPAMQNAASGGKMGDAWGPWLRDIETMTPAEWFDKQDKYRDMDGIQKDIDDIKRSTKNFVTSSRDFNTTDIEAIESIEGYEDDE